MATDIGRVSLGPRGLTAGADAGQWIHPSGAAVALDFLTASIIGGHGCQVRMGVLTTHVTGDIDVTTVAAEASADSTAGHVIMPTHFTFDLEALGGTLPQATVKLTATPSSAGTAFVPLPLQVG